MLSLRRGGGGGVAGKASPVRPWNSGYPRRTSVPMPGGTGDGAAAALSSRTGSGDVAPLGISSFSPIFQHHRLVDAARRRRPVLCSPVAPPPPPVKQRSVRSIRMALELAALKGAIADMFRPLVRNLAEICSLRSAYDIEDYQIGMLFGAFLGYVGCYQLWKTAPSLFVDATLAFVFYKLSVVSSELHRQRKSNSLTTRLKFGTILIMVMKDIKKNYVLLDIIRGRTGCRRGE